MAVGSKLLAVALTVHPSLDALQEACDAKIIGCAEMRGNVCYVHVLQPQIGYRMDFEVIGHELWHCYYGEFH